MGEAVEMKLLPCPFCGDAFVHAELVQPDGELWGVHCPNGRCPTIGNFVVTGFSEEEVVADWNRRASPPPTVDAEEVARVIAKTHRGTSSISVSEAARAILALLPAPGEVERLREALERIRTECRVSPEEFVGNGAAFALSKACRAVEIAYAALRTPPTPGLRP